MDMKSILMRILTTIKDFFMGIFADPKLFIITILSFILIFLYFNYRTVKSDYENIVVNQQDSIFVYKNKNDELYAQIGTYITDIEHLKHINSELYEEVTKLKENPIIVTKVETEVVFKEKEIIDTVIQKDNNNYIINHIYSDPFAYINMSTNFALSDMSAVTTANLIKFPTTLKLDLIESKKGDLSFIVNTDNPYIKINNVNGVVLSPEDSKAIRQRYDKKWCVVAGVGPAFTIYDNKFKILPAIQVTLGYKIFAF